MAAMVAVSSEALPWASNKSLLGRYNKAKRFGGEEQCSSGTTDEGKAALVVEQLCGLLHTANLKYGHLFTDEVRQVPGR